MGESGARERNFRVRERSTLKLHLRASIARVFWSLRRAREFLLTYFGGMSHKPILSDISGTRWFFVYYRVLAVTAAVLVIFSKLTAAHGSYRYMKVLLRNLVIDVSPPGGEIGKRIVFEIMILGSIITLLVYYFFYQHFIHALNLLFLKSKIISGAYYIY